MPRKAHLFLFYAWLVSESMFNRASEPLLTPMSEKSPLHGASRFGLLCGEALVTSGGQNP